MHYISKGSGKKNNCVIAVCVCVCKKRRFHIEKASELSNEAGRAALARASAQS